VIRDRRDEPVRDGAHGLGGHRRQVGHRRAGLVEVDLVQRRHVGVEHSYGLLNEHHCDVAALLPAVRAVRERVHRDQLRADAGENDFAVAFLVIADRLGLTA
jgi:hypothetical protein